MRFVVLGPVRVEHAGAAEPPGGPRDRFILASLLAHADRPVPTDGLVDQLWPVPPETARAQLHNLVSRLRRKLDPDGAGLIVSRPGAYELKLAGHELDLLDFRAAVRAAADAAGDGDAELAYQGICAALDLWRGPAFADVPAELLRTERAMLTEEWQAAREQALVAGYALGRYAEVVERAESLLAEEPYRERALEWAMLAHAAAGRPAEAVRMYDRAGRRFVAELGVEPGAAVRELRRRLAGGSSGTPSAVSAPRPRQLPPPSAALTGREKLVEELTAHVREPAQGSGVAVLTGQGGVGKTTLALTVAHELAAAFPDGQLYAELRGSGPDPVDPYDVAGRFLRALGADGNDIPDGRDERLAAYRARLAGTRTFILLDDAGDEDQVRPLLPTTGTEATAGRADVAGDAGEGDGVRPLRPAGLAGDAGDEGQVRALLPAGGTGGSAGGVDVAGVAGEGDGVRPLRPVGGTGGSAGRADVAGEVDRVRALLPADGTGGSAGRADAAGDAGEEDRVRALLPADEAGQTSGCAVLVTSRYQLAGLAGAEHWRVPLLSSTSAIELLRRIAGPERVLAEPDAAEAIVAACGRLPLAVCVAAARLAVDPGETVAGLGERLGAERGRLDELRVGDLDVRATIGLSYERLSPSARQLFRRLGLVRTTDWPEWVAAELRGSQDAARPLDELLDAHLLEPLGRDATGRLRFRMHDLIADVARERAELEDEPDEPDERRLTEERLLTRWLGAAALADEHVSDDRPFSPGADIPDPPPGLADVLRTHPRDWFETERTGLVSAVVRAAELDRADLAGRLALSFAVFASIRNYLDDKERVLTVAVEAVEAVRTAGPDRDTDELLGSLLSALSTLRAQQNAYAELKGIAAEQRAIARRLGDPAMELRAVQDAAFAAACVGTLVDAGRLVDEGLELARERDLPGVISLLTLRADLHNDVGEYDQAVRLFREAMPELRANGRTRGLAISLGMYANVLANAGEYAEATAAVAEAREIATDLGDELGLAHLALNDAETELHAGRLEQAERGLRRARRQLKRMDDDLGLAAVALSEADLHTRRADRDAAYASLQEALAIRRALRTPLQIGRILARLERIHRESGRTAEAEDCRREWQETYAALGLDERALQLPAFYP